MDLVKVLSYFNAVEKVKEPIQIVGCGAIGSHVAEQLVRIGCTDIHLWDFDKVEPKNIANQMFVYDDIGQAKVDAVEKMIHRIDPGVKVVKHPQGIKEPYIVNGYVFLCVDSIDLRREIVKANRFNPHCIEFHDFRMRLTDAQYYYSLVKNKDTLDNMLETMNFTSEEAQAATQTSACGTSLSVIYTVKNIVTYGICNFVRARLGEEVKNIILTDMNFMDVRTFTL